MTIVEVEIKYKHAGFVIDTDLSDVLLIDNRLYIVIETMMAVYLLDVSQLDIIELKVAHYDYSWMATKTSHDSAVEELSEIAADPDTRVEMIRPHSILTVKRILSNGTDLATEYAVELDYLKCVLGRFKTGIMQDAPKTNIWSHSNTYSKYSKDDKPACVGSLGKFVEEVLNEDYWKPIGYSAAGDSS